MHGGSPSLSRDGTVFRAPRLPSLLFRSRYNHAKARPKETAYLTLRALPEISQYQLWKIVSIAFINYSL